LTVYIIRRILQALLVIFIVTIILFLAVHLLPGDPILIMMTANQAGQFSESQLAGLRHQYGLDRPLIVQYFDWLGNLFHGDMGISIQYSKPVAEEIARRIPITFHIGALAFVIGFIIGLPAGVICAVRRGKWLDTVVTILANAGITIPGFWLAIMLMYLISLKLNWLPIMGYVSPLDDFWDSLRHIILPVFCLAIFPIASTARQTRSSMLEVLRQDYMRTAWAKGLKERTIVIRHGLKNGLIPVVTLTGMGLAGIIGGAVLIEQVFNIPGMGRFAVQSVLYNDYPAIQGITLIIATSVVFVNLVVDVSIGWLDPRIRYA
jgi:peptide/nickel transport system permease protein